MRRNIIFIFVLCLVIGVNVFAGNNGYRSFDKATCFQVPNEFNPYVNPNAQVKYIPMKFEDQKYVGDYLIGPEIPITGLSGFYDYQTNGECQHHIYRNSATIMHAVYCVSTDSLNQSPSRRSEYAYSTDDGATWSDLGQVPSGIRSGFCTLSAYANGTGVIANHFINPPTTYLQGVLNYDITHGSGSFTPVSVPYNYVWPGVARMNNGNFLVVGETYQGAAATDTAAMSVWNATTHTFGPLTRIYSAATSQLNMRWTYAADPNSSHCFYIFDAISDVGGNFGQSRIFISMSTDNGTTWPTPTEFFNPIIINGTDTLAPFFGLDAIYDNSGNYYVAFNTTSPTGFFNSAKLWVSKNGGTPVLVAENDTTHAHGVPSASLLFHADAGICTIDHPSLSISSDNSTIFVGFSVQYENDTLGGYNKCHMFYTYSPLSALDFVHPIQVTNSGPSSYDERYCNLAQTSPVDAGGNATVYFTYQKDPQPGSSAFNDNAPITRASMILRKITFANRPIGIKGGTEVIKEFKLNQNYPNPFNPTTMITFNVKSTSRITMKVYNPLGQLVTTLINNALYTTGERDYEFNASNLASGIYFYTLTAVNPDNGSILFTSTKKMILVK